MTTQELGPVLIVDLGCLNVARSGDGALVTLSVEGRLLGLARVSPEFTDPEALFTALDDVTAQSWVDVDHPTEPGVQVRARVAWLNPFTAAVSVGRACGGSVFTDHRPVVMEAATVVAHLMFDSSGDKVLALGSRVLREQGSPSMSEVTRAVAAHC